MGLRSFSPEEIDAVWPLVESGIEKALETSNGEGSAETTKAGLKAGRTNLLIVFRNESYFGMVVQVCSFPNYNIARVLLGFGKGICLEKIEWQVFEGWAKEKGCKCIEAWVATESRARMFSRFGFKKTYQIIRSEL